MKWLLSVTCFLSITVWAHENHEHLPPSAPLPGSSLFQLDSEWQDQAGHKIKLSNLKGHTHLSTMLFTSCDTACPLIINDIKDIISALPEAQRKKIHVTIFSLDPARDTPAQLKKFSQQHKLTDNWQLLTSKSETVAELAAALGFRFKKLNNGDYVHSNVIYLVDKLGVVKDQKVGLNSPNESFVQALKKVM